MSGSDRYDAGAGTAPAAHDCNNLVFDSTLASATPAVVASCHVGDIGDVVLIEDVNTSIAVLLQTDGSTIGTVTDYWPELMRCLRQGKRFIAEILATAPGLRVRVRPRGALACSRGFDSPVDTTGATGTPAVGDTLAVGHEPAAAVGRKSVLRDTFGGFIGNVLARPVDLADCLAQGHTYTATVTSGPPDVVVHVAPVP